jgi:gamma-glutamyltranspeptidase/glutathione hydrolase
VSGPTTETVSGGVVVASHQAAADAGAGALAQGGTAVDAAVATAFALTVVDPASCGLGGYGGFLVYAPPTGPPVLVDFNTWAPRRLDPSLVRIPGDTVQPRDGGISVAPPAVVPGLLAAHALHGRRPLADLVAPAVRLARDGFAIGRDLTRALSDHWVRTEGGSPEFTSVFLSAGRPPERGSLLVQPDLAVTLETIARDGAESFRTGPIVDAICAAAAADGGFVEPEDLAHDGVEVGAPEQGAFGSAVLYGPPRVTSGAGVLFSALDHVRTNQLGSGRGREYVSELARALRLAWNERSNAARGALSSQHTTHLCAADAEGGLASLTFTHGHRRFGSGLVAPGTGIVLNSGINLFAPTPAGPLPVTNMTPVVVEEPNGDRHAIGSVGGPRIPGIILGAVVDLVHYGASIAEAIASPHLSVRPADGALEAEAELLALMDDEDGLPLVAATSFGTTCGITVTSAGAIPGPDHRFEYGLARA